MVVVDWRGRLAVHVYLLCGSATTVDGTGQGGQQMGPGGLRKLCLFFFEAKLDLVSRKKDRCLRSCLKFCGLY